MENSLIRARIDLKALAHNLNQIRVKVGPDTGIMGVVKADAYGHGLLPVAACLARSGVDALGVMDLHEALVIRDAGFKDLPVFILGGFEPGHADEIIKRDLTPFVYDAGLARELNKAARRLNRSVKVSLKIDTGMNRLGVPFDLAEEFLNEVLELGNLEVTGLATHFSEADFEESSFIEHQLDRFEDVIELADLKGYNLTANNAANSAAVLSLPRSYYHLVRPGLILYGAVPGSHLADRADLRPAMSLISQIIQVKKIGPGSTVSYGRTWTASRDTILATIPVGYAHGYDRRLSGRGYVLIGGKRAPIRGRVCMNLIMVDVTHIPEAYPGGEVVLLGKQGGETITGDSLAEIIGTISYELFCTFGSLNHREYVGEAE
jgi:alanine racemase